MKKILWILACVWMAAIFAGCDIGVVDGPGMEYNNPDVINDTGEAAEDADFIQDKVTAQNASVDLCAAEKSDAAIKRLTAAARTAGERSEDTQLSTRVQREQAVVGGLLICFMATAIVQGLRHDLFCRRSSKAKAV